MAKQSPPIPVMCGSAAHKTAFIANAASTAFPPFFNISIPTEEAIGCEDASIALELITLDLPISEKFLLILLLYILLKIRIPHIKLFCIQFLKLI
jgi:hypothetical protein